MKRTCLFCGREFDALDAQQYFCEQIRNMPCFDAFVLHLGYKQGFYSYDSSGRIEILGRIRVAYELREERKRGGGVFSM